VNPTTTIPLRTRLIALLALPWLLSTVAQAATLHVGPEREISTIAEAARIAQDGDTVLIDPGEYRGDVAVWTQQELSIRGKNGTAVLKADGEVAEGKAIWVFRGGNFNVENIEFRGARAPTNNGAGIRFERGRLHLRDCVFVDNQMGLLSANDGKSELIIENSRFANAPRQDSGLPHLLYVGRIARLELSGSRFENGYRGHLVKSRARENDIRYNLIFDGPDGASSYQLEFPDGGQSTVIGNIIGQSAASGNRAVIAYGAENPSDDHSHRLVVVHNTLVSAGGAPANFIRRWDMRLPDSAEFISHNNLAIGRGRIAHATQGDHDSNILIPAPSGNESMLEDADYVLSQAAQEAVDITVPAAEPSHRPEAEFIKPIGTKALNRLTQWWAGALQPDYPKRTGEH